MSHDLSPAVLPGASFSHKGAQTASFSVSYTFSPCMASLHDLGSAVIVEVRSDLFSTFEINLFARSTVKEMNGEIKSRSGLVNLLVKKNSLSIILASHLTLQEAGLLVSPSVFCFQAFGAISYVSSF